MIYFHSYIDKKTEMIECMVMAVVMQFSPILLGNIGLASLVLVKLDYMTEVKL